MRLLISLCLSGIILLAPLGALGSGVREQRPNLIGGELGGRAGIFSVNYEHYLNNRFGIGIGGMPWGGDGGVIPVYLSTVPAGDVHALYLSAGVTFLWDNGSGLALPALSVGYQFQSHAGFYFRLSVGTFVIMPLPAVALGGSF